MTDNKKKEARRETTTTQPWHASNLPPCSFCCSKKDTVRVYALDFFVLLLLQEGRGGGVL